jgi:hypothetical protein
MVMAERKIYTVHDCCPRFEYEDIEATFAALDFITLLIIRQLLNRMHSIAQGLIRHEHGSQEEFNAVAKAWEVASNIEVEMVKIISGITGDQGGNNRRRAKVL